MHLRTWMTHMYVSRATSNEWKEYLFYLVTVIKEGITFDKDNMRTLNIGQGFE